MRHKIVEKKNFCLCCFYIAKICDIVIFMKRSVWFWIYFAVAIILAIYFTASIIMVHTGKSKLLRVNTMSLSADQTNIDLSPLVSAAGVTRGTLVTGNDLAAINERINAVPGVRNCATLRRPNGNISIHVQLERAVALWTDGENYFPLSADGTIVKRPTEIRDEETVLFRGNLPSDISEITKSAHNLVGYIDYLEWIEDRRWNIITTGGITVMLPERDPTAAIANLIILNNNHGLLSKQIKILDMRDPSRILVK